MKFYDREAEQQLLAEVLAQSRQEARMTVLMGRRRIGKTELSLRCGDDTTLYFFVGRKAEALLCRDFSEEITNKLGVPLLGRTDSFAAVFRYVLQLSESRPFTLVIDEFQNFQRVNPSVFSDMQRDWDLWRHRSRLNLIISGSVFTLMKRIFEDYKEPLFGRANEKLTLQPFRTGVLKEILSDFRPDYTPEDLLALFSITGGVAWYVALLLDRGKTSKDKMLRALTDDNSPFAAEGRNILIEEFGADYVVYFSILTCIASGMKTSAEIKNELGIDNISSYLARLEQYYGLISKHQPIFAKESSKKVRYQIDDCFLVFWFRFFFKYQALTENMALKALGTIISRDYDSLSGLMLERYFARKFREEGRYIVGQWWDRRGFNEIDLVVVDPVGREAWAYEVKKDAARYDAATLDRKVEAMLAQTPELRRMTMHTGLLCLQDM